MKVLEVHDIEVHLYQRYVKSTDLKDEIQNYCINLEKDLGVKVLVERTYWNGYVIRGEHCVKAAQLLLKDYSNIFKPRVL